MPIDHSRLPLVCRAKTFNTYRDPTFLALIRAPSREYSDQINSCQRWLQILCNCHWVFCAVRRAPKKVSSYLCLKILLSSVTAFRNPYYRPEVCRCSCAVRSRLDYLASKSWRSVLCPCLSRHSPRIHSSQTRLISLKWERVERPQMSQ